MSDLSTPSSKGSVKFNSDAVQKLIAEGKLAAAKKSILKTLKQQPHDVEALYLLGCVQISTNNFVDARKILSKAYSVNSNLVGVLNALGMCEFRLHNADEAEKYFLKAVLISPNFVEAVGNLGLTQRHLGKHDEALESLRQAVTKGGATHKILEALGEELLRHSHILRAEMAFKRLLEIHPSNLVALSGLGLISGLKGDDAGAQVLWAKAEELDCKFVENYAHQAVCSMNKGDLREATTLFEKVLKLDPSHGGCLFLWAHVVDGADHNVFTRAEIIHMAEKALKNQDICFDDEVNIQFSLGKLYHAEKEYDLAFSHYEAGNERVWERQPIARNTFEVRVSALTQVFNPIFFEKRKNIINRKPKAKDKAGEGLIFIVGMPRSGTTLTEQIVSCNHEVMPGGEREDVEQLMYKIFEVTGKKKKFPEAAKDLTIDQVRQISAEYHQYTDDIKGNCVYFTDKTTRNFLQLGLLALLFPKATFINCVRDPIDTSLSCYFNYFALNAIKYSYDLETLGRVQKSYGEIMGTWRRVLPVQVFDFVYEEMVADPESKTRQLVDFCGFSWSEAFLSREKNKHAVSTASVAQVRKPIYKGAVGRWHKYQGHIGKLLSALE